ncbi:MAG: SDR family oxidoreductase [Planctomycetes bacterium]|nr:SDR family oxidoreductase [Planctomycetota bacterium]
MADFDPQKLFDLKGKVAFMTGASGVLGSAVAKALGALGVKMVVTARRKEKIEGLAEEIRGAGGTALAVPTDVMDKANLEQSLATVQKELGPVDFLLNFAGGNHPDATTNPEKLFWNLPREALSYAFDLNLLGTILPCQVFGKAMAERKQGCILNVSSMAAYRPLTRAVAYASAKAAISNFTQWLAVHMAKEYSPAIRVNAIAPGFFLTEQNRYLLTDKATGKRTPRGQSIIDSTPQARYGEPEEIVGAVVWLLAPSSTFVTGVIVPIDGGFDAFSGV